MSKQKLLILNTLRNSLRAEVDGWGGDDGNNIHLDKPIGLSMSLENRDMRIGGRWEFYPTVMHAIGDGWRLMGPPVTVDNFCKDEYGIIMKAYEWWLEK